MMKTIQCAVIMDDIATINFKKDSTLAMLLAAQKRQWPLFFLQQQDLFFQEGDVYADGHPLHVFDNKNKWFELGEKQRVKLADYPVVLMRKDPPFNLEYIYTTYLLDLLRAKGTVVVNNPQSLRDANEKLFITWFSHCCPPTLVTRNKQRIIDFIQQQQHVVLKPLDTMGGSSIFMTHAGDPNSKVIIETLTEKEKRTVMVQKFIPEVKRGDKRILLIDGEPVPYGLLRVPPADDFRANLAVGGHGVVEALTPREQWLCQQVGPELKKRGLLFVGLDVIGDYITEINVTSPTCIREIEAVTGIPIGDQLLNAIEKYLP